MKGEADDPIRVLHLLHGLGFGGAEHSVYSLAVEMRRHACVSVVCSWRRSGPFEAALRSAGVPLETPAVGSPWRTRLRTASRLRQLLQRHRIDLIHAHMSDSALWGIVMQRLTGLPCVITHHSTDLIDGTEHYRWLRRKLLLACARRAAGNTAVSRAARQRLAAESGLPAESIALVSNATTLPAEAAVESTCAARRQRAATGFNPAGNPTIVYVGRMTALKAVDTVLAAAPYVLQVFPNANFVLVGGGDLLETLRQRVEGQGMAARFLFPGWVTDVVPFLSRADLFVSASRVEGLPLAIIEAMSWGVPVVASDIDGHQELLRQECGTLVPLDEPELLGAAIVNSLRDWHTTEAQARRARDVVREDYRSDAAARRYFDLYGRILREFRR